LTDPDVSRVAVLRVQDEAKLYDYVAKGFDLLDAKIPKRAKIIIKPNLNSLRGPQSGTTTDVRIVDALIRLLNEKFDPEKIAVVESNSWARFTNEAFSKLQYSILPQKHKNVELINLSTTKAVKVLLPKPTRFKFLRLPWIFFEYNYYITVPKLRTFFPTKISCALKNQFGCVPERYKAKYHPYLDKILANLNLLIRPDLCVVDGLVGNDGDPKHVGILMFSNDPVANDTIASQIMGLSPKKISHLALCNAIGIGRMEGIKVSIDSKDESDLSVVQKRFNQTSLLLTFTGSLGFWVIRTANRLESISRSMITLAQLLQVIPRRYSKREILRMIGSTSAWKLFLNRFKGSSRLFG